MTSILEAVSSLKRFADGVLGADKYQRYLEHHRAHGREGEKPMSEREFWRSWQDWQESHPEGRCC